MLSKYGLPDVSAMHLENRLFGLFDQMKLLSENGRKAPFLTLDHLIEMAENNEIATNEVSNAAIRSRLEAVRNTGIFASHLEDAVNLKIEYSKVQGGGALVIDVSALSPLARYGFAQAILDLIKEMCEDEIKTGRGRFPFVLFEEAHLYVSKNTVTDVVTRSRHLGITCFFITNMVGGLDETVLRQTDNLFLAHLPFDDDVRHIGKSAMTDQETMSAFVKKLRRHHALIMGNVTRQYPIIIKVKALPGIRTAGETQFFFKANNLVQMPPQNGNGNGKNGNGRKPESLFGE
jgi:DNA helicase HerA-like ATPase